MWRYLSTGDWGVTRQRKRSWWMAERWTSRLASASEPVATQAQNGTCLSTQGHFDTLNPCALTYPHRGWLDLLVIFSQPVPQSRYVDPCLEMQGEGTIPKGTVVPCKPGGAPECATVFRIRLWPRCFQSA